MDTPGECARHVAAFLASPFHHVIEISDPYENRRGSSAVVRVYVEIRLPGDPGTEAPEPEPPTWTAEYIRMQPPVGRAERRELPGGQS